jgi:hypothetical protein
LLGFFFLLPFLMIKDFFKVKHKITICFSNSTSV